MCICAPKSAGLSVCPGSIGNTHKPCSIVSVRWRIRTFSPEKISSTSQSNGFGGFFCGSTGKSSASPASYASQCARSGQTSQFGVPGTHTAAPKSISA